MRICFLINPTDNWQQAVKHAYQLAIQAQSKYDLSGVFFYGSSVKIIQAPQYLKQWQNLSECPLFLCRTMMEEHHLSEQDTESPFNVVGMAPWIMMMEQADRIVEII